MNTDTEKLIIMNQVVIMISLWEILGSQPHDRAINDAQHRIAMQIEQTETLLANEGKQP